MILKSPKYCDFDFKITKIWWFCPSLANEAQVATKLYTIAPMHPIRSLDMFSRITSYDDALIYWYIIQPKSHNTTRESMPSK